MKFRKIQNKDKKHKEVNKVIVYDNNMIYF